MNQKYQPEIVLFRVSSTKGGKKIRVHWKNWKIKAIEQKSVENSIEMSTNSIVFKFIMKLQWHWKSKMDRERDNQLKGERGVER